MNPKPFEIFISHAVLDTELATDAKDLLSDVLGLEKEQIFCSSDGKCLEIGGAFNDQLVAAHRQAKAVVALMTPNSLFRPWVLIELAAAHFCKGKLLCIMTANGVTPECIPAPFNLGQSGRLSNEDGIHNLLKSLSKTLNITLNSISTEKTRRLVLAASRGEDADWRCVRAAIGVEREASSPFRLSNILDDRSLVAAKNRIYIFTQDSSRILTGLRGQRRISTAIFQWLNGGGSRKVRIILTEQDAQREQIRRLLQDWKTDASKNNGSTFKARITKYVPQDLTFVDPKEAHGYAVLSPHSYSNVGLDCPQFVVRKNDGQIFDYYWHSYHERMLNPGESVEIS